MRTQIGKRRPFGMLFDLDYPSRAWHFAKVGRKTLASCAIERLEDRTLLTALTINMTTSQNSIIMQLDPQDHTKLLVTDPNNGVVSDSAISGVDSIRVNGVGGSRDTLTLDFSQGNFLSGLTNGGLTYNANSSDPDDTLNIVGNEPFTNEVQTPDPGLAVTGSIVFDSNPAINYAGAAIVNDTEAITGTAIYQGYLNSSVAAETINIVDGSIAGGPQASQINDGKTTATANLSQINFANKPDVIVDARNGVDTININNPNPALNLSQLTVEGTGSTGDTFNLINAPAAPTNLVLNGNGNSTLHTDDPQFVINNLDAGFIVGGPSFSGMPNLVGGADDDTFTFTNSGALAGTIDGGGAGANGNRIIAPSNATIFDITGTDSGFIDSILPIGFANIQNLTGGLNGDTFNFTGVGKLTGTASGGRGSDTFSVDSTAGPISVDGGDGFDSLIVNADDNPVDASTPSLISITGEGPVNYYNIDKITINNAPVSFVASAVVISGVEGMPLNNIGVGSFTGGPLGAAAGDFTASIDWSDGSTSAGSVTGSNGSFAVTGSHTYAEEGNYSPVAVTITDSATQISTVVGGVPITTNYTGPLNGTINDSASISDPNVIASTPTKTISAVEGSSTGTVKLATFTDPGGPESLSDYSATVDWGDGSPITTGTISVSAGVFCVSGIHTYVEEGTYSPVVTISHDATVPQVVTDTNLVKVKDAPLSAKSATMNFNEGRAPTVTVATFTDGNPFAPQTDFTATINWGDGHSTAGTIVSDGSGHFHVIGAHAYAEENTGSGYTVKVKIADVGGSTASATSIAKIADSPLDEASGLSLTASKNVSFSNKVLGSFRDQDSLNTMGSDYKGTINWGDGTTSSASFVANGSIFNVGSYWKLTGSHKYTSAKTYTVKITLHDTGSPNKSITIMSTIKVS